ncbi:MAG TPA: hypothetical protein VK335_03335 [Bryobacteraceae bacterium]|nr:hypothetical protein [Bryobacteraceae bacterium]
MIRKDQILVGAAAALVLFWQLVLPPPVGVADNGDFLKLTGRCSLGAPNREYYIDTHYAFDSHYNWQGSGFYSSELLLFSLAMAANEVLSKDGSFDLRVMGCIHGALFLAAVILLVPLLDGVSRALRLVFCGAALFMFCDVMYVSYFNSFYMDVAGYLSLLLAVVLYLRVLRWRRRVDAILLVVCTLVAVTSKPQHALLGIWFTLLFLLLPDVMWGGRKLVAAAVSIAMLLATWAAFQFETPPMQTAKSCFNVAFMLILPNSKNVDRTLAELGLDNSYRKWIGSTAYAEGVGLDERANYEPFKRKLSYGRLAWFFLTHPLNAYRSLRAALNEGGMQRPKYLGNFEAASGQPARAQSQSFAAWSDLKRMLFYDHAPRFLLSFLGLAVLVTALLALARRSLPRGAVAGGMVLIGMAFTEMLVSSLAEGMEPARHLMIFFAQFDMLLLAALWLMVLISRSAWAPPGLNRNT